MLDSITDISYFNCIYFYIVYKVMKIKKVEMILIVSPFLQTHRNSNENGLTPPGWQVKCNSVEPATQHKNTNSYK